MVPTESFLSSIPQHKIEELLMNLRKGIDIQPDLDEMFQPLLTCNHFELERHFPNN